MAFNIYMTIPGIPGEVTDTTHAGKIGLLSCDWSFETQVSPDTGGLAGPLLPRFVKIVKSLDRSTPLLIQAAGTGATLSGCEILAVNSGAEPLWRLVLGNCRVEHINQHFTGGGDYSDVLSLGYTTLQVDIGPKLDGSIRYTFPA